MKKLITILLMLCAFTASAQQVGLSLAPQGSQPYTAGNSFQVFANYNYSNITGNVEVSIIYNSAVLSFCGSPSFPYSHVTTILTPTTRKITYTFPATAGNNQTGVIMMCFNYICPQTCFGQNISATFNGTITAPAHSLTSNAAAQSVNAVVNNNWTGQHTFYSYNQLTNEVTFKVTVHGSSCFSTNNPFFVVNPSAGTLVSATDATVSGNTFTPLNATTFSAGSSYTYYYTIRVPCDVVNTLLTSNITLKGDNCNNSNVTIRQYPPATHLLPAQTGASPGAAITVQAFNGYFRLRVVNNGNTPLNTLISNTLPPVKTNFVQFSSTTQSTGLNVNLQYSDCGNIPSAIYPLTAGNSNSTPPVYATKADITVNNLQPMQEAIFFIYYDLTNSCSGVPTQSAYTISTTLTYQCTAEGLTNVCQACDPGTETTAGSATYTLSPDIACIPQSSPSGCFEPGDTVNICLKFRNTGTLALNNGVLNYSLTNAFSFVPGSEVFTGFSSNPVYQPGTSIKWDLPAIPTGQTVYGVCFKAVVTQTAPYGGQVLNYSVAGTDYSGSGSCPFVVNICALPMAEVEKLVKGNLDATFSTNGNGHPGSVVTYQVTVKNTGNTPIDSIVLIDRMPFVNDRTIMACAPRNSQFAVFPTGPVTIPGATVTYSSTPNVASNWITAATSCAAPGTFSSAFAPNNLKIELPVTIAPGNTEIFTFTAQVPANAAPGQMACNSIGMICRFVANNNIASALNPVESNVVCLTVQERVEPPPPCEPCKDLVTAASGTQGQISKQGDHYLLSAGVDFSISKPVQEVRISLASLDYSWENKGCADCQVPAIGRGCLFPQSATQTIGGLVWDNYANAPLPPNANIDECMEELIWKLGSAAPAGTYNVPLQISLPAPTVPECCALQIKSICLRITFKDKDCNTCDTVICIRPATEPDCCRGGRWTANSIAWGLISHNPDVALAKKEKTTITGPVAAASKINAKCDTTYSLSRNVAYSFFAKYICGGSACPQNMELSIVGPNTNITQQLINTPYTHTFSQPGTYTVSYTAYCGGKVCEVCRYKVVVKGGVIGTPLPAEK